MGQQLTEQAIRAVESVLIAAHKPALFVEVVDSGVGEFVSWLASHAYHVERLFPDKTHCNYLCLPDDRRGARTR